MNAAANIAFPMHINTHLIHTHMAYAHTHNMNTYIIHEFYSHRVAIGKNQTLPTNNDLFIDSITSKTVKK